MTILIYNVPWGSHILDVRRSQDQVKAPSQMWEFIIQDPLLRTLLNQPKTKHR